ncbi:MBL fold metallo-hydrolase [Arachidicoccus terrestris]|uniref:MBL fold metallo-hydrolase n=1 Tax=Arachidicoccus terrestris TaxID=2875539 RepID=UPI001CC5AFC1|nr:MBL fold metallo-hydrolase [Arachidicoccus terrestris]UAY56739.1 MBL fold metallo-hydrolase [Arachidicoccus terrestris]
MDNNKKNRKSSDLSLRSFAAAFLLLVLALLTGSAKAQSKVTDWTEPVTGVFVHPIFHASLELKTAGKTLLVDPSFDPKLLSGIQAPDLILLTDIHGDHMDPELLAQIRDKFGSKPIIAPKAVAEQLPESLRRQVSVLENGRTEKWEGYTIQAVPMYNLPGGEQVFHPKGRGNGYVLTVNGKRIYLSGDTEATPELRHLKNIDLAFVCMNLPYTMDVEQAAAGVLDFQPKVVIPYHYKGSKGLSDINQFKKLVDGGGKTIKVELLDFYPQQ